MIQKVVQSKGKELVQSMIENGMRIATLYRPQAEKTSIGVFIQQGAEQEEKLGVQEGSTHMLEHAIINKIEQKQKDKYNIHGYTTDTYMGIVGQIEKNSTKTVQYKKIEELIKTLMHTMTVPVQQAHIEQERDRVLEEKKRVQNTTDEHIEHIMHIACGKNKHKRTIIGTVESIKKITHKDVNRVLQNAIEQNSMLVVSAGCIEHSERHRAVEAVHKNTKVHTEADMQEQKTEIDNTHKYKMIPYKMPGTKSAQHMAAWNTYAYIKYCTNEYNAQHKDIDAQIEIKHGVSKDCSVIVVIAPEDTTYSIEEIAQNIDTNYARYIEKIKQEQKTADTVDETEIMKIAEAVIDRTEYTSVKAAYDIFIHMDIADVKKMLQMMIRTHE